MEEEAEWNLKTDESARLLPRLAWTLARNFKQPPPST